MEKKTYYLDDAATTKMCRTAIKDMLDTVNYNWGNSHSTHEMGRMADAIISNAKQALKEYLNIPNCDIYFTSSASEANKIVNKLLNDELGCFVLQSEVEHSSNFNDDNLQLPYNKNNFPSNLQEVCATNMFENMLKLNGISSEQCCTSHMLINNESGEEFLGVIQSSHANYTFVDCTQALYNQLLIRECAKVADIMTVSFHKIHAAKGLGAIIIKLDEFSKQDKDIIQNYLKKETARTQNTPSISTIKAGLEYCKSIYTPNPLDILIHKFKNYSSDSFNKHTFYLLQDEFKNNHSFVGAIRNIRFKGVHGESLVAILSNLGVYCSSGSACLEGKESYVLKAMGVEHAHEYIRISSHTPIGIEEADEIVKLFDEALKIYDEVNTYE